MKFLTAAKRLATEKKHSGRWNALESETSYWCDAWRIAKHINNPEIADITLDLVNGYVTLRLKEGGTAKSVLNEVRRIVAILKTATRLGEKTHVIPLSLFTRILEEPDVSKGPLFNQEKRIPEEGDSCTEPGCNGHEVERV